MNRRSAVRTLVAGAGSLFGRNAFAAPAQDEADNIIHSESRLVVLDVSVKTRDGNFVSGLSQENFSVFENDRPQRIAVFDHGDPPVTVGLLVDESRSMTRKRPDVIIAAMAFVVESNRKDEIFVLNFNDEVTPGLPSPVLFSDDVQELRRALFRGVSQGRTALNDAVVAGLTQLKQGSRDKKALVLISDGGDNASTHTRREMLDLVEASTATVYTIGLFDADDPDRDPGLLKQIARISGGEAYFPSSLEEMVPACRRIARDIRARYTVGYVPAAGNRPNDIRNIRVGASRQDHARLITRTRSSYRYDPIDNHRSK
ncbi:MAG TPA: VWA domain-containing protein [Bryobacteraceae bacterium]|jgi:VWFA-related protein